MTQPDPAWNATDHPFDDQACLHAVIARQALSRPQAIAVRCEGQALSYRELDERAAQLAAQLMRQGVQPGAAVGLCLPRSLDMVVAVLAVLRSGAAYVPLDPSYPADRLAYQLADSGAALLVSTTALRDHIAPFAGSVLAHDALDDALPGAAPDTPAVRASDLAYVIYTSGSTGRPKGVQIEHRSVLNFVGWVRRALGITPDDVFLAQASLSFDMSVLDLFVPLCSGASLEIAPADAAHNGRRMLALLQDSGATWLQATPSAWRLLVEAGLPASRRLGAIVGGEALPQDLAGALHQRLRAVWNFYGPTETTVYSTATRYQGGPVLIGRPIDNTQIHILAEDGHAAPVGQAGELHIGGAGLARGYLNQPALTAERFIDVAAAGRPAERLYRTGDLARWTADGQLEYLGRNDDQVKIRGYRIELGEIESRLRALPGLKDAVVVARADALGVQRLVAYVVPASASAAIDADALKAALRVHLPEFMLPSVIVGLDALPMTPNQKVDRQALPDPLDRLADAAADVLPGEPPLDAVESIVAQVWSAQLGREIRSRHADFFDLGGHSLLALTTVLQLEERFGHAIPLDSLWADGCTVAGLAQLIRQFHRQDAPSRLVPIRPGRSGQPPLYMIHTARGSVNEYFALAHRMAGLRPVIGVRARGVHGETPPADTIEALAADCVAAIRAHQPAGPYHVAGFSLGGLLAFEVASQLEQAGEAIGFLGMFDTTAPGFKPHYRLRDRLRWRWQRWRAALGRRRAEAEAGTQAPQLDERDVVSDFARPLQRALLDSIDRYVPTRSYAGTLDLFVVRATAREATEPTLGWHPWLRGDWRRHDLQAEGHLDIVSPTGAEELAQRLDAVLDTRQRAAAAATAEYPNGAMASSAGRA